MALAAGLPADPGKHSPRSAWRPPWKAAAVKAYGAVDVLFNYGAMACFAWIDQMDDDTWFKTINEDLNLVFCSRARRGRN